MEILEKILIWSHVLAGAISLIAGFMAAFAGKKGGKLHRQVGKTFFWSMFWIFVSALIIVTLVRFSFFLTVIAVFSFYLAFSGYRVLKIKRTMKAARLDWAAAIIAILFGLGLLIYGGTELISSDFESILGYLSLFFGFFTIQTGYQSIKGFMNLDKQEKMWWWFAHMNAMCGSLIAAITAFLVQNGRIFGLSDDLAWLPWVLPVLVGAPLINFWSRKYRKQFFKPTV